MSEKYNSKLANKRKPPFATESEVLFVVFSTWMPWRKSFQNRVPFLTTGKCRLICRSSGNESDDFEYIYLSKNKRKCKKKQQNGWHARAIERCWKRVDFRRFTKLKPNESKFPDDEQNGCQPVCST